MKLWRAIAVASVLTCLSSLAFAQGYGNTATSGAVKGDVASSLEALEHKINDAFKNQDSKTFLSLVDANAWSADAMGFTPVSEMAGMMKDIVVKSYSIEGYKVMMLDKDIYLATFTWRAEGSYKGQALPPNPTYCSTVWAKRGKEWKALFHQESLAMEGMPAQAPEGH